MRFLYVIGSGLGWVFLIYFLWNKSIPAWFKFGVSETAKITSELVKNIPTDWKPSETEKKEAKTGTDNGEKPKSTDESKDSKSLFSGEIKVGNLRSRYNLDIQQNKETEELNKQDMGAK
jgi:hypothetical protein